MADRIESVVLAEAGEGGDAVVLVVAGDGKEWRQEFASSSVPRTVSSLMAASRAAHALRAPVSLELMAATMGYSRLKAAHTKREGGVVLQLALEDGIKIEVVMTPQQAADLAKSLAV